MSGGLSVEGRRNSRDVLVSHPSTLRLGTCVLPGAVDRQQRVPHVIGWVKMEGIKPWQPRYTLLPDAEEKGTRLSDRIREFEATALPHLDAAYNLARWLLHDGQNAQDAVQEAYLRGYRYFDGFKGGNARPWLLGIVRNVCFSWLRDNGRDGEQVEFDEERDSGTDAPELNSLGINPERALMQKQDKERIDCAIEALPPLLREVIILRELEDLPYESIARIAAIPLGTVMSRLYRARERLRALLSGEGVAGVLKVVK